MSTFRFCVKCNKKFEVEYRNQQYCSNECQKGLPYHRRRNKCKVCGEYYKPTARRTAYYCSWECSSADTKAHSRFIILERDNFTCIYCGRSSFEDSAELHIDHVVPHSKGGTNTASNLVTACKRCNLEKHDKPLMNPDIILNEVHKRNVKLDIDESLRIDSSRE